MALRVVVGGCLVVGALVGLSQALSHHGGHRPAAVALLAVTPEQLTFAAQTTGTESAASTIVLDAGRDGGSTVIRSVHLAGPDPGDFVVDSTTCVPRVVTTGQSCEIAVRFAPRSTGARRALLTIERGPGATVTDVALSGVGQSPAVVIDQPAVAFGPVAVGGSGATRVVRATNVSSQPVQLEGFSLIGDNPGDFAAQETVGGCSLGVLRPHTSCDYDVAFEPTVPGDRAATLAVAFAGPASPALSGLTGQGALLSVGATPGRVKFGVVHVGSTSNIKTITLSNTVTQPVTISAVAISGPDAAYFRIVSDACAGKTLAPKAKCAVLIQFSPGAPGTSLASLTIRLANDVTSVVEAEITGFASVPRPPPHRRGPGPA